MVDGAHEAHHQIRWPAQTHRLRLTHRLGGGSTARRPSRDGRAKPSAGAAAIRTAGRPDRRVTDAVVFPEPFASGSFVPSAVPGLAAFALTGRRLVWHERELQGLRSTTAAPTHARSTHVASWTHPAVAG
ncbi:MAG: hypothetical protein P8Z73_14430, partial [Desulfobacteraceae bacterium]